MRAITRTLTITGAAALVAASVSSAAIAADMSTGFRAPAYGPQSMPVAEFASGWYLRGDIGYRYNRMSDLVTQPISAARGINNHTALGGGVGYKYHWLRADITLDYGLRTRVSGDGAGVVGFYNGKVDSLTALFNAYVDLGNWGGFTPYLGAGIGASRNNVRELDFVTGWRRGDRWELSWAAMAGASVNITPNLLLDVGYRYLRLGDAVAYDAANSRIQFKGLSSQEVRVGLRFMID